MPDTVSLIEFPRTHDASPYRFHLVSAARCWIFWSDPCPVAVAGVHPRIMGIGPVAAIPKVLKQAGMSLNDIDLIELNEAFASQALAVIREVGLDPAKVNINGGAIALGHPLGCTGAKLTIQNLGDMKRLNKKYGMVTACVGGGQGIAGIIENLQ